MAALGCGLGKVERERRENTRGVGRGPRRGENECEALLLFEQRKTLNRELLIKATLPKSSRGKTNWERGKEWEGREGNEFHLAASKIPFTDQVSHCNNRET